LGTNCSRDVCHSSEGLTGARRGYPSSPGREKKEGEHAHRRILATLRRSSNLGKPKQTTETQKVGTSEYQKKRGRRSQLRREKRDIEWTQAMD